MTQISAARDDVGNAGEQPALLAENADTAFIGYDIAGDGFVLDPDEAQEWIDADPHNAEVLYPYLNAEDLDSQPDCAASRWAIDFKNRCLLDASFYPLPFERAKRLVYAERQNAHHGSHRQRWWQYGDKQPAMRNAIAGLDAVIVMARDSEQLMPVRVSTDQVFDGDLVVFALDSYADLAVLASSAHQLWADTYRPTHEIPRCYRPTDVFETFLRPTESDCLKQIGGGFETARSQIMVRRGLSLTALHKLVNDPQVTDATDADIAQMRTTQAELDRAVVDGYGWSDIPLDHGFHHHRWMSGWTVSPAAVAEIARRLQAENRRRAAGTASTPPQTKGRR